MPAKKNRLVSATGVPMVCMRSTIQPSRNVIAAARKRPTDVVNPKALARHSVRILFRYPKRVHGEVSAAEPEHHQARQKPFHCVILQIVRVSETERDGDEHHKEIHGKGPAPAVSLGQRRQREASQNCRHRKVGSSRKKPEACDLNRMKPRTQLQGKPRRRGRTPSPPTIR